MASEINQFAFDIPAGTPLAAPVSQALSMPPREITQVNIKVPPGPRGMMGFALGAAGQAIIPANPNDWVVTDNEQIVWPLDGFLDSGAWEVFGYNVGQYSHTIYLTFYCNIPGAGAVGATSLVDLSTLNSGS